LSETTGTYTAIYLPAAAVYANPASAPPGGVALVLQGNNPDIRPETSRTWTFGAEVEPAFVRGLTVSLNYYAIRFSNRIVFPAPALNLIGNPAFASIYDVTPSQTEVAALVNGAQVVLDATGGATPASVRAVLDTRVTNTALTTTRGFDLALRYRFAWNGSQFTIDAAVTHIIDFENQLTPTSPQARALDRPFQPLDWRGRGGIAWARHGFTASLFANHADAYLDDRLPIVQRVAAYTTFDASLSYSIGSTGPAWLRGTRISLFAENLFDALPPRLAAAPGTVTGIGYDPVNATARGRFVSLQLRRTW
jgi:iron complex outermembrane receptor protein